MKYKVADLMVRAKKAWFEKDKIYILLADGREVNFPVYLNEKLRNASPEQIAHIEIICGGSGLHWPDLDEDLSISGILDDRFGMAKGDASH